MDIALFTATTRLVLGGVAAACVFIALLARRRGGRVAELATVLATLAAMAALFALAAEQLVGLTVTASAPDDVAYNEWRWVLAAPWGRAGIIVGIAVAAVTLFLGALGTRRERLGRRALLIGLRAGACAAALVLFIEPALELATSPASPTTSPSSSTPRAPWSSPSARTAPRAPRAPPAIIARSAPVFERWRDQRIVDFFTFSTRSPRRARR